MNKVVFFLMGKKGLFCLKSLSNVQLEFVHAVVFANDKNVANDYVEEIKEFCAKNKLQLFSRLQWEAEKTDFEGYAIAISWRWLINNSNIKLIVLHDSLLPKYRGFNPLVTALINGDNKIGVTALIANKEFDRGDIIGQSSIEVKYPIKIEQAIDAIIPCYVNLVQDIFNHLKQGDLTSVVQDESQATYSLWRDEEDYLIHWEKDAKVIEREVNALGYPYSGARTKMDGKDIIILEAIALDDIFIENRTPGKIMFMQENQPEVVCGKGLLKIQTATSIDGKKINFSKFRQRFK